MAERRLSAGAALSEVLATDPAARAAWERTRNRLRLLGQVLSVTVTEFAEERNRATRECFDAAQEALSLTDPELEAAGFELPKTIDDWEHLARIVEMPFEIVRSGDFTLVETRAVALAWADRQRLRAKLAGGAAVSAAPGRGPHGAATDTEAAPPALTLNEIAVMRALSEFDQAELASASRIEAAMDPSHRVSERSIGVIVHRLREIGLAERPMGDRSGVRLTTSGRRLLRKIAD